MQQIQQILEAPLDFSNYKFRCSSWGNLMGEGRGGNGMKKAYEKCTTSIIETKKKIDETPEAKRTQKTYTNLITKLSELELERVELEKTKDQPPQLSQTAISHLIEVYCMVRDGVKKDIHSKYFEKGLAVEESAIELLSDVDGEFYVKNTERLENDFISGECDIFHNNSIIIDNKACWDRFTFQKKTIEKINEIYKWQGIGYMGLWGVSKFVIANTLMNMPENLIEDECKRILYQYGSNMAGKPEFEDAIIEFKKKCNFDHLPNSERVFKFPVVEFSEELYNYGIEMVKIARNWLNEYAKKEFNRINGIETAEIEEVVNMVELVEVTEVVKFEKPKRDIPELAEEIFSQEEIQEIVDENEENGNYDETKGMILTAIPDCESIEKLNVLFNQIDKEFKEDIEIINEFSNREKELSAAAAPPSTSITSDNNEARIENCKSKEEVISLYTELKPLFSTQPELKELLTQKRNSFDEIQIIEETPAAASVVEKPKRTAATPPPTTKPLQEGELTPEVLEEVRGLIELCKTTKEIRQTVAKYFTKTTIEYTSHRELKKFINEKGLALQKIEEANKQS